MVRLINHVAQGATVGALLGLGALAAIAYPQGINPVPVAIFSFTAFPALLGALVGACRDF